MAPRINYASLFSIKYAGLRINKTVKPRANSEELSEQLKREHAMLRVIYQRDAEIPIAPREPPSQKSYSIYGNDMLMIPLYKVKFM